MSISDIFHLDRLGGRLTCNLRLDVSRDFSLMCIFYVMLLRVYQLYVSITDRFEIWKMFNLFALGC